MKGSMFPSLMLTLPLILFNTFLSLHLAVSSIEPTCSNIVPFKTRPETISIVDYGGIGDGENVNTDAFREAIYRIEHLHHEGGTTLYVPKGVWLTAPFNLTSHMTLFLAQGAVIRAVQDTEKWPLVEALPSYGRGRELPGGRYMSLIRGDGIQDVIITGNNGTIDGQGDVWWNMWRQRTLLFTRPHLLEFLHSTDIIVSNLVFIDSPFWNIHPVYCSNVVAKNLTILAPHDSPNTDGIDPDSSNNVCIEDSYISTGDDVVAIKSGWDEYGIAFNRPSSNITVQRITGSSPFAGIAIGSEASGGVENVLFENINISNSGIGIHIKTNEGRGGFIRNITINSVNLYKVRKGIRIAGNVGDHPDEKYDPSALPVVDGVVIKNVRGVGIEQPGSIQGIKKAPFVGVCMYNVKLLNDGSGTRKVPWKCTDVSGSALVVEPEMCPELESKTGFDVCSVGV